jgi:uncharacterized delta-60 repeat protein
MILSWLGEHSRGRSERSQRPPYRERRARARFQPQLESLENRALLSSPGSLDPHFGTGGLVTTNLGGNDVAAAVAAQLDGKIVAVGTQFPLNSSAGQIALARYNPDGSLDQSFGSGGTVLTPLVGAADFVFSSDAIAIRPDGKIDVEAFEVDPVTFQFNSLLLQYNRDGSLD